MADTNAPRDRAQGDTHLPIPEGMVLQGDTLVAIRATLYGTPADDDSESPVLNRTHDVRVGPWQPTLTALMSVRFAAPVCEILQFEIDHIGTVDALCPLRLERAWEMSAGTVVVEIALLPCGADEGADHLALVADSDDDEQLAGELGWQFALELEQRWELRGAVPSRRLDVDFLSALEQAPLADAATTALAPVTPDLVEA